MNLPVHLKLGISDKVVPQVCMVLIIRFNQLEHSIWRSIIRLRYPSHSRQASATLPLTAIAQNGRLFMPMPILNFYQLSNNLSRWVVQVSCKVPSQTFPCAKTLNSTRHFSFKVKRNEGDRFVCHCCVALAFRPRCPIFSTSVQTT
jgi:hypothetical protein